MLNEAFVFGDEVFQYFLVIVDSSMVLEMEIP